MAITKEKKEEILQDLQDKFGKAKSVYFADYRGLDVKSLGELRAKMRESSIDYKVAKKTLFKLAAKNNKLPDLPEEVMEGPVGAAFGYEDEIAPAKILHDFSKSNEALQILGGLLEGKFITKAEAIELAKLPSKDELIAKLVGSINAPISGFYGTLSGLLRNFVYVLKAAQEKMPVPAEEEKPEETAEEKPAEEKPAEEAKPVETAEAKPAEEAEPVETAEAKVEEEKVEETKPEKADEPAEEVESEEQAPEGKESAEGDDNPEESKS